jgi:hypothetical protein
VNAKLNEAHLHVAFCDIERCDTCVRDTAGKDTTEHALGVVRGIVRHGPGESNALATVQHITGDYLLLSLTGNPTFREGGGAT